jgi:glycosyltransferase involved in cell wall biosynthesis
MTSPSISVVVPVYNRSHCVGRAIRSVLDQDHPVHEILVVDDGSSDDLIAALKPFGERVRVVRHPTNQGAAAARNAGFQQAAGDFVAFLDSDDVWKPGKLTQQIDFMRRLSLDASCTGFEIISARDGASPTQAWRPYPETLSTTELVWGCYTSPGSTLVVCRDVLSRAGGYDASFPRYEDWDLLLRLAALSLNGVGFLKAPLATIHLGRHLDPEQALLGLERIVKRHYAALQNRDPRLARRFRSAVAFNKAYVHSFAGRWICVVVELAKSFLLCPANNWPLRVILGSILVPRRVADMVLRPIRRWTS